MTSNPSEEQEINSSSQESPREKSLPGTIDLNCDMGEGIGKDELIMPFISSANIACGYHAGDEKTILKTIEGAVKYKVAIGAHVSFADKENFGRSEMSLPAESIYQLVRQQLIIMQEIAGSLNVRMKHVKPHGALYNMSAKDAMLAKTIATAIKELDESLVLFGLSGSHSIREADSIGLKTASEVFADRTYQDNGSLTPRSQSNALIEDSDKAIQQALNMITKGTVITVSGKNIPVVAETICIHGDGKHADEFARNIYENLKQNDIVIKAI